MANSRKPTTGGPEASNALQAVLNAMDVPPITEKAFMSQVLKLAKLRQWKTYHTHDSRRSAPGFPDLICVRGRRMLALELKRSPTAKVTASQQEWIAALMEVDAPGLIVAVVTPEDWSWLERTLA